MTSTSMGQFCMLVPRQLLSIGINTAYHEGIYKALSNFVLIGTKGIVIEMREVTVTIWTASRILKINDSGGTVNLCFH